jgi:hypothetical protein
MRASAECEPCPLLSPQQVRRQQQHEEKLTEIQERVADGSLVIRKMTPEERELYPPQPPRPASRGSKRRS